MKTDDLDASISTRARTNSRIKIVPFSACAYACVCAVTNKNEIPLRHNTRSRILSFWPVKTLDPDYLAPNQFGKLGWVACMLVFASWSSVFTLKYHFVCAGACGRVMLASLVETIHLKRFESIKLQ